MLERIKQRSVTRGKVANEFWLPKPKRFDFMTIAILIPVIASAVGLFLMAIESFVFVQFGSLSQDFPTLRATTLTSGFFMAFGGEVGTVANNTEIFSKHIKAQLKKTRNEWDIIGPWDWFGFGVSWVSSTLSVIIASSTREIIGVSWQAFVAEWLVIPLMIIAVGDVVFGTIELGFRFGTFDARMTDWIRLRKEEQDNIDYLSSLSQKRESSKDDNDESVLCWCGQELKNDLGYNRHQIVHKNESLTYNSAQEARAALQEKYANTIQLADIPFPSITQVVEWRKNNE